MAASFEAAVTLPFEGMRLIDLVNFVKTAYAMGESDEDLIFVNMDHPEKKIEMPYGLEFTAIIDGTALLDFDRIEL